jgi:hypothetical protein
MQTVIYLLIPLAGTHHVEIDIKGKGWDDDELIWLSTGSSAANQISLLAA